jgi:hypothetical protein
MESGQQVHPTGQGSSSSTRPTLGSSKKRVAGSRPSSPILRSGGVKEESPEPELDEVSLLVFIQLDCYNDGGVLSNTDRSALRHVQDGCSWSTILSWNGRQGGNGDAPPRTAKPIRSQRSPGQLHLLS